MSEKTHLSDLNLADLSSHRGNVPWLPNTSTLHTSRVINSKAPQKLLLETSPQHLTCSESAVLPFTSFWAQDFFRLSCLISQCTYSSTQSNFNPGKLTFHWKVRASASQSLQESLPGNKFIGGASAVH